MDYGGRRYHDRSGGYRGDRGDREYRPPRRDDDDEGKFFVGGLNWDTDREGLRRYFSKYGDVVDAVVIMDRGDGYNHERRSKGFGFVTFKDPHNVQEAISDSPHEIDGRKVKADYCNKRGGGGGYRR